MQEIRMESVELQETSLGRNLRDNLASSGIAPARRATSLIYFPAKLRNIV